MTRGHLAALALIVLTAGAAAGSCPGDCDGSGVVTVDELVRGVTIALGGAPLSQCSSLDGDGDGNVGVAELVRAVGVALSACPATATPSVPLPSPTDTLPATATGTIAPTPTPRTVDTLVDGGPGSLRAVLATARAGDTVSVAVAGVLHLTQGPLVIDIAPRTGPSGEPLPLRIDGPGATALAISADGQSRVLEVRNGFVVLHGMTIRDGRAGGAGADPPTGGGILTAGELQLEDCIVRDNSLATSPGCSWSCAGAGIYSSRQIVLDRTWVTGNDAGDGVGGGVAALGPGLVTIRESALTGNRAGGAGGGLWFNSAITEITNSTISANTSAAAGGGIGVLGPLSLFYSTVADNQAASGGGVAYLCSTQQDCLVAGASFLSASIAAANRPSNCLIGAFVIEPYTGGSIDDDGTCHLDDSTDRADVDSAGLAPLSTGPGPPFHPLVPTSPALDVLPGPCGSPQSPIVADQRGAARPVAAGCDSGAVERQPGDP